MKICRICLAVCALLPLMSTARADEFRGLFIGARVGENASSFSGNAGGFTASTSSVSLDNRLNSTAGLEIGYNASNGNLILGFDGYADFNSRGRHAAQIDGYASSLESDFGSSIYGGDLKLGIASGYWMPYAKLGYGTGHGEGDLSGQGSGPHYGLGAEYRLAPRATMTWELSDFTASAHGGTLHNTNFSIGVNFYLE